MDQLQKKEIVQAVVIADNFNESFSPITNNSPVSLMKLVNVPLIDYTLESLNRSGVEEVFVFVSNHIEQIKEHIKIGIASKCSWSIQMSVQIVGSEGCRCIGDALRDLDAKGLIRGHFILMGIDTVSNAQLMPILEQHKRTAKFDKGAAMTVIYKRTSPDLRTGDEVLLATDKLSNRLLFHQRIKPFYKERHFSFPLEIFLINSEVILHHDLIDPNIAICSPSVLPLFADNFDFETRDDFIRGLLINEEILASTIYVHELPREQYASRISNWLTYQIVSNDIINRWVYPLVPDMGICCLKQNYVYYRNNIYRSSSVQLSHNAIIKEDCVINDNTIVNDQTVISFSVIGKNCIIGMNCVLNHTYINDNTVINDNCILNHCVIGKNVKILTNCNISDGAVIGDCVVLEPKTKLSKYLIQSTKPEDDDNNESIKFGPNAYSIPDIKEINDADSDEEDEIPLPTGTMRMLELDRDCASSIFSSSSNDDLSEIQTPIQEDANIFLSEVIDSLARGYSEKSNPEFLILEINSSRYAYNMTLSEVNFYVVKAVLNLPDIKQNIANGDILIIIKDILNYLGPVMKNYIKGDEAMLDCLKSIEDTCLQNGEIKSKIAQIIHHLYDKEYLTEDAILSWYDNLNDESEWAKAPLSKLIDWLNESSEEESEADDDN